MGRRRLRYALAGLLAGLAAACALPDAGTGASAAATPASVSELAGQTILTGFAGREPSASLRERIRRGEVGGVILFSRNFRTPAGLAALVGKLQAAAAAGGRPPLLVALDQEGGTVRRLPDGPPSASANAMGAADTAQAIAREGEATAAYLRRLGVDVDLAPVLDVASPTHSFLGTRTFGSRPTLVASKGVAFADGLQRAGVAATAKHFPGLGTARGNTDDEPVVVRTGRIELERRLLPMRRAVAHGVRLVMVSNASYPALDPSGLPADLSPRIVGGLLRSELGFHGVVVTDTLAAPAPAERPDAPVEAIGAGVDLLLYPTETGSEHAFRQLVAAVSDGELSRGRLAGAAAHVAALKRWLSSRPAAGLP